MKQEKAKENISNILESSVKKNGFYYKADQVRIYEAIIDVLISHKIITRLSFKAFEDSFSKFQKRYKMNFKTFKDHDVSFIGASEKFLSFLDKKTTPDKLPDIPRIQNKRKGVKKARGEDLKEYKEVLADLNEFKTKDYLPFIKIKSYRLEKYKTWTKEEKSYEYICNYYGLSQEKVEKDLTLKEYCELKNNTILSAIKTCKLALDYCTPLLFTNKNIPRGKMWFVDIFGEASDRYLPNWQKHKRASSNTPDFNKSYDIFKKFINGTTSSELGYIDKKNVDTHTAIQDIFHRTTKRIFKYHHLRYRIVPQGLIMLLYEFHTMLYSSIDKEKVSLREKTTQVKEILKDTSYMEASQILRSARPEIEPLFVSSLSKLKPLF